MEAIESRNDQPMTLRDRLAMASISVDIELIAFAVLLVLTVATRFYDLGTRVMSHDESLHTYFSWKLADEGNFRHDPLMHGPLQFHLIALSYFLFGVSDASARVPAALASIAAVVLMWGFRRWIGKWGALLGAVLMAVSPYMLYYGRYVRNEALVVPLALAMFYAVFRYYEDRQPRWLYLLAGSLALHFTAKETAFIYTAQLMLFLGLMLSWRWLRSHWQRNGLRIGFIAGLVVVFVGLTLAGAGLYLDSRAAPGALETAQPADPSAAAPSPMIGLPPTAQAGLVLVILGVVLSAGAVVLEFRGRLRSEFPALDLLIVASTMTLPQLAAFPSLMLGWDPLAYTDPVARTKTAIVLAIMVAIATGIGIAWNWRRWLIAAGVFFGLFALFYTTVLTYPDGLFTGLVGSLGYWLEQHEVNRGSQPLYYYLLIQVPIYEFLPAIGALFAGYLGLRRWRQRSPEVPSIEGPAAEPTQGPARFPVVLFLGFWALTSTLAYTIAGERMPWLTVHITFPYILLAGWSFGQLMQTVDWRRLADGRSWLVLGLAFAALISLAHLIGMLLSPQPAFDGAELDQLRRTGSFIFYGILLLGSAAGAYWLARGWQAPPLGRLLGVVLFAILLALTVRTSFRAAFINYDRATEYLVYAHSATGVKTVLAQIEELSRRTTDGMGIDVGYDDDVSWPFSWYIRQFPNNHYYQNTPSRDLLNYPVVIAGDNNWATVEPILGGRYLTFEYIRMWWPMQDYFDLSWERVWGALRSPEYRVALWDIWFQRDYTAYGQLTGGNFALDRWSPADRMKLYIRRDVAAMIWDYGVAPQALEGVSLVDPYAEGTVALSADPVIAQDVGLTNPRDLVVTEQGDLLVADSGNHRIVKLDATGQVLATWGQFGAPDLAGPQPAFNEPWGLALAPDGSIYVADTWNHRVVHLSADGEPLDSIGEYGEAQTLESFWGPRDVAVDADGRIFVADTGNKRIVVFDTDGNPLFGIGSGGAGPGLLDEPVGLAVGPDGRLYVADTWNQRIQVFEETAPNTFDPVNEWTIDGWYGQSLNNKPYLDISSEGDVCTSDPEGYRILCFEADGTFSVAWGDLGSSVDRFGLPSGLAFAGQDLWVVDNGNLRLMRFAPPFP